MKNKEALGTLPLARSQCTHWEIHKPASRCHLSKWLNSQDIETLLLLQLWEDCKLLHILDPGEGQSSLPKT